MKKLTVVGRGAVGSLAVAHFLHYTDWNIEWIFDKNIPTVSVGEATNLIVPNNLNLTLDFNNYDLLKMNGTAKLGISKKGWSKQDYFHPFPSGLTAMHFAAKDLQDAIYNKVKTNPKLTIVNGFVDNPENLDSDFVMMCVGSPNEITKDNFVTLTNIPVNSAYVTQCEWDYPRFQYSLTDAMPNGWVFGIPLQNRISIGYMYNDKFTTLEEVKQDVKKVFKDYNLTPSEKTTELHFESYYRKQNFTPKVVYNGNASFFLEPLEATSTGLSVSIIRKAWDLWNGNLTAEQCQRKYEKEIDEIESMILLHYMSGSVHRSKFWAKAKKLATSKIKQEFINKSEWSQVVLDATTNNYDKVSELELATWGYRNYQINIKGLGLEKEIKKYGEFFKNNIKIVKYKEDIWNNNQKVRQYINNYFDSGLIQNSNKSPEANGKTFSTAGLPGDWIFESNDLKPLIKWITDEIKKAYLEFYNRQVNDIGFQRDWSNKMYKNSSGDWHTHSSSEIVGIFYLNVPDNGAHLITENEKVITKNGDLVLHRGDLSHAVSEHESDEPRIVLVFDTVGE